MKGALALRKPVGTAAALDTSSTNVTNSAYVQLVASTKVACSALLVSNGGAQALGIAVGSSGHEVDTGAFIPPGGQGVIIPIEIPASSRISLKSLGGTQSSGIVALGSLQ